MKRVTFLIFYFLICTTLCVAQGQDLNCPQSKIFGKAETAPVYKNGMQVMRSFFSDAAAELVPPNANGTIEILGVVCFQDEAVFLSFVNKTGMFIDTMPWKRHFEDMKGWKAGIQNGRSVSHYIKLTLAVRNGNIVHVKYDNGTSTIGSVFLRSTRLGLVYS